MLPILVVSVSLALRIILASQGGQYYFADEDRYDYSLRLYQAITSWNGEVIREIVAIPTHAFFIWFGSLIAACQHGLAQFTTFGDWTRPENIEQTLWLGAAIISLFSALNLLLLYRLARNVGASEGESAWALLLMATSNTAFYYSRHFLPYDCALSTALGAVLVSTGRPTVWRAIGCGLLAGATYNIYNGYWYLVPIICLLYVQACRNEQSRLLLVSIHAFSMAIMLLVPIALGAAMGGSGYWITLWAFGTSAKLGLFSEGWSLPLEYFWHSEGVFGVLLAAYILLTIFWSRSHISSIPEWVKLTCVAILAAYGLLVLFSNGLKCFVVYARTVKPFVPLICLLGGWAINRLLTNRPRMRPILLCSMVAIATVNFSPHFNRVFPRDVEIAVLRNWGNPKRTLSITGSLYTFSGWPVTRSDLVLVNACGLYPIRSYVGYPLGKTLLRIPHPLTYLPFQYECHTPRERALLRTHDISIRLIKLSGTEILPNDPPLSMLYLPRDHPTGYSPAP